MDSERTLGELRESARRYGLSQAEYDLLFAVVEAAERRRVAEEDMKAAPDELAWLATRARKVDATRDENAALDALYTALRDGGGE